MSKKNYRYNKDVKWQLKDAIKFYHKPKGRIKRMRKGESKCNGILRRIHGTSIVLFRNDPNFYEQMLHKITRWTRH